MTHWTQAQLDEYMTRLRRGHQPVLPPGVGTPAVCEIPPDEGPESHLQSKIRAWCKEHGYPCLSFPRTKAVRMFLPAGWPDEVIVMPKGRVVWIEDKSKGGRKSPKQVDLHIVFMALGHEIHVVRSYKQFLSIVADNCPA